jgi:predicted methyltransferase
MKKTRILKYIKQINPQEYNATIIIPLTPITFSSRSIKQLKEILIELLATQKKILKKKEKEIMEQIISNMKELVLKRNFNILINDELIEITPMHEVLDNEQINIDNYYKDIVNRIKILKISTKLTYLIFEYNIKFILEDN